MKESQVRSLFTLADIEIIRLYWVENQYWPDNEHYDSVRKENPWWLVKTHYGLILIGRRKHVYFIDWEDTEIECNVTEDKVTKDKFYVHAWTQIDLLRYLGSLSIVLKVETKKKKVHFNEN